MRCSVVFGVTSRLLVINISSSSFTTNTAAYYQRCVITCESVAVVHRRLCWRHLACCSANSRQSEIYAENRDFCLPHLHLPPTLGGFQSEYCHPVWCERKLEWCGYPTVKKMKISLFVLTQCTNVSDTHTHTHTHTQTDTAWRHGPRLHSIVRQIHSVERNEAGKVFTQTSSRPRYDTCPCNGRAETANGVRQQLPCSVFNS